MLKDKPLVYDELEDITGLDRGTIKNLKSVAEATSSRRHDDLSFSHHVEVAPLEYFTFCGLGWNRTTGTGVMWLFTKLGSPSQSRPKE